MQANEAITNVKENSNNVSYHYEYSLSTSATVPGSLLPSIANFSDRAGYQRRTRSVKKQHQSALPPRRSTVSKKTIKRRVVEDDLLKLQEQLMLLLGRHDEELEYTAHYHPVRRFMLHRGLDKKAQKLVARHSKVLNKVQRDIALDVFRLMLNAK